MIRNCATKWNIVFPQIENFFFRIPYFQTQQKFAEYNFLKFVWFVHLSLDRWNGIETKYWRSIEAYL